MPTSNQISYARILLDDYFTRRKSYSREKLQDLNAQIKTRTLKALQLEKYNGKTGFLNSLQRTIHRIILGDISTDVLLALRKINQDTFDENTLLHGAIWSIEPELLPKLLADAIDRLVFLATPGNGGDPLEVVFENQGSREILELAIRINYVLKDFDFNSYQAKYKKIGEQVYGLVGSLESWDPYNYPVEFREYFEGK